eukprot:294158-Amphidinium_carterae.1
MSERQKPSLAAFEECDSAKCLHLKRLRNVKVPNALTGDKLSPAVFEKMGTKSLHFHCRRAKFKNLWLKPTKQNLGIFQKPPPLNSA